MQTGADRAEQNKDQTIIQRYMGYKYQTKHTISDQSKKDYDVCVEIWVINKNKGKKIFVTWYVGEGAAD